ncbi:MAG: DNA-directed RNA polymerase subunit L [Candidatus Aenigmatarchaeota archaeon]
MELKVLENEKNKLKIEVVGENHTILNILRENCWKSGAKQAAYVMDHPYLTEPKLTVRAENPKKVVDVAAELTEKQVTEFLKEFRKAKK